MSQPYTVDYFIAKFEAIPEELWMTDAYTDGVRCCALGHCGARYPWTDDGKGPASALLRMLDKAGRSIDSINDGRSVHFPQSTPKQRILAALRSLK